MPVGRLGAALAMTGTRLLQQRQHMQAEKYLLQALQLARAMQVPSVSVPHLCLRLYVFAYACAYVCAHASVCLRRVYRAVSLSLQVGPCGDFSVSVLAATRCAAMTTCTTMSYMLQHSSVLVCP
jgi:hypothetical protein